MWARAFPRGGRPSFPCSRCWSSLPPWSDGCTGALPPSVPHREPHPTTTTRGRNWRRFPSRAGTGRPTSPGTASANRGVTTSTSSSATTAAIPETTSAPRPHPTGRQAGHLLRPERCPDRLVHRRVDRVCSRPGILGGGPDRPRRLPVGCLVQGRPRLGRAAPPRFRQRPAQPAGRRRKSQLRQGLPRRQRLATAERGVPL
jgi:hypothetical protein